MMGRVQVPPNPLIDATGHHGTAARISRVLESVMREEDQGFEGGPNLGRLSTLLSEDAS